MKRGKAVGKNGDMRPFGEKERSHKVFGESDGVGVASHWTLQIKHSARRFSSPLYSLSHSLSLYPLSFLPLSLTHSHTHTLTHSHTHTLSLTYTLSFFLSNSHTLTHSLSHSHSLSLFVPLLSLSLDTPFTFIQVCQRKALHQEWWLERFCS
jgi:hypothetical protein